ncbi:MAG TPA: hypothetical protein VK875_11080 [Euzebyales bacterium]|nr:hypothetical protein [Euzebyales bacterium]
MIVFTAAVVLRHSCRKRDDGDEDVEHGAELGEGMVDDAAGAVMVDVPRGVADVQASAATLVGHP